MMRRRQPAVPTSTTSRRAVVGVVLAAGLVFGSALPALTAPASARPAPVGPATSSGPADAVDRGFVSPPPPGGSRSVVSRPVAGGGPVAAAGDVRPGGRWQWPLTPAPAVVRGFRAPPTPWSPGHRGVDLRATMGATVASAGDGVVAFAGQVAGRGVVTVDHPGGLRTTYEPVAASLPVGAVVRRGERLGVVTGQPGHCSPGTCLHWGLRREAAYLDPLLLVLPRDPPVLKPVWR